MEDHTDDTASFLSTDEGDLLSVATNFSHELEGGYTDADESMEGEIQIPLTGFDDDDDGEGEGEGEGEHGDGEEGAEDGGEEDADTGEKRPPVLSRIASGMRKSLTNLFSFSIFASGPVDESGEGLEESVEGSYEESATGGEQDSVELDAEQNGGEPVHEQHDMIQDDDDVEIHDLLLDEAAAAPAPVSVPVPVPVLAPAPVIAPTIVDAPLTLSPAKPTITTTTTVTTEQVESHEQFVFHDHDKQSDTVKPESSEESDTAEEVEMVEGEAEVELDKSYVEALNKRLSALTKTELSAQLRKRGVKAYGLKDELVSRLLNLYIKEEVEAKNAGRPTTINMPTDNGIASTPRRGRGRPRKVPADEESVDQKPVRLAKRRRVDAEDEAEGTEQVVSKVETKLAWPSLMPAQLPRAYEPSCGWGALPFDLPDPAKAHEWDLENNEDLRNKVALLRLWVLSQPINLEQEESASNPTFFTALSKWQKPTRETKKAERERLQNSHGLWVYGMEEPPQLPTATDAKKS